LSLFFHPDHQTYLFIETKGKQPKTASVFRKEFPLNISIIPTLGPFEIEEELLDDEYVKRWYGSRRSPRMFRSFWFYNKQSFGEFKKLVEQTWKGMSILSPERKTPFSKELMMFYEENHISREICWAGFGFQIWLQLLTHICNSTSTDLLVVDEPEIYLHPDLQHRILDILKNASPNIIIATHSVEIINTVEPSEVLLINKINKGAKRISDLDGLQSISNILGSGQNIQLTRLARGKKILFVEGKDLKLLNKLAKIIKLNELFNDGVLTVIPIEGFSQHEKILHTNWAFAKILGEELKIAVLLDRDYRTNEENDDVLKKLNNEVALAHVLNRKEIENYFIIPKAIKKAIDNRIEENIKNGNFKTPPKYNLDSILNEITEDLKENTLTQLLAHRLKLYRRLGKDEATVIGGANQDFNKGWKNMSYRFSIVSGKEFMALLNIHLQNNLKLTITNTQIANNANIDDLGGDIIEFLVALNKLKGKN
jgi:hypothetical protein